MDVCKSAQEAKKHGAPTNCNSYNGYVKQYLGTQTIIWFVGIR